MRSRPAYLLFAAATVLSYTLLLSSCGKKSMEGMLIVTRVKALDGSPDPVSGEAWRLMGGSQLCVFDRSVKAKEPLVLTEGFYSACSPSVSYDARSILFSGQQKEGDPWQIWEMELASGKTRQITSGTGNSADPAYLPNGKVIFSRSISNDSLKSAYSLFTCAADGSGLTRITYNPHSYFASSVLADGRVLAITRQVFPETGRPLMMVLRPDGTKCELFYETENKGELLSRAYETSDGHIVFVEAKNDTVKQGCLASVRYNRPLHSHSSLSASLNGEFWSAIPSGQGKLIVSYRAAEGDRYSLYEFDPEKGSLGEPILKTDNMDLLEAVTIRTHAKERKLPSEVDNGVKTGLLFCQNIEIGGLTSPETPFTGKSADRIEIMGVDSSMGVVEVEKDGSLYLKINANTPFRIRTMDASGKTINGPGSWIWLRPNERRGCTGCHEDQEMVPANRVALAVKKNPVVVPVHISGIKEKQVELE